VAKAHGLGKDEELLGWLYVGGKPTGKKPGRRKAVDARKLVTRMPKADAKNTGDDKKKPGDDKKKTDKKKAKKK
jgi:hypothetical protein